MTDKELLASLGISPALKETMSLENFDPETWHPVRLPGQGNLPDPAAGANRWLVTPKEQEMIDWCRSACDATWLHAPGRQTVFWFEASGDAIEFSLKWFPFRAL